jgi:hypothetical protein
MIADERPLDVRLADLDLEPEAVQDVAATVGVTASRRFGHPDNTEDAHWSMAHAGAWLDGLMIAGTIRRARD